MEKEDCLVIEKILFPGIDEKEHQEDIQEEQHLLDRIGIILDYCFVFFHFVYNDLLEF